MSRAKAFKLRVHRARKPWCCKGRRRLRRDNDLFARRRGGRLTGIRRVRLFSPDRLRRRKYVEREIDDQRYLNHS